MKNTPKVSIALLAALTASSLNAQEFKTKEFGVNQISPAQRYSQSTGSTGQLSVAKGELTLTDKTDDSKVKTTNQSTSIEAIGNYQLPMNAFTGIQVGLSQSSTEIEDSSDLDATGQELKPFVGINITPNVAVAYELEHNRSKIEDADEITYNRHKVGVVYHNETFEVGGAYEHKVDEDESKLPSTFAIHGQAKVADGLALGAVVKQNQYKDLDSDLDNTTELKVFTQYSLGEEWDFEGAVGYQASNDNDQVGATVAGASKFDTQIGAYYNVQKNLQLGSSLKYGKIASDTRIDELEGDAVAFSVQANYVF